jgi:hypothetical protein
MSEKCKCTSYSAIQVKSRRKVFSTEEKLDVLSRLEIGGQIVGTRRDVMFAHNSLCTTRDNADRITEIGNSETNVFV